MTASIRFLLDGSEVEARPGETIWQVAKRLGNVIPHLCHRDAPGYRADGNCRACVVEVEGERALVASCIRAPTDGMRVETGTDRALKARDMVLELLVCDQPARERAHDPGSLFWRWVDKAGIVPGRFPSRPAAAADNSHPAMAVNLDACIHCGLCVRACREVQVNDVIGMAARAAHSEIVFDFGDPMGDSICVACGECVQACPTGALMPASVLDEAGRHKGPADRTVGSLCPYCGVGCQLDYHVRDERVYYVDGRDGPANHNRLCVKGRFGVDYAHHPHRLTVPLIRKADVPKDASASLDPANPFTHFREARWDEALDAAAAGFVRIRERDGPRALAGFGSAKGSNEEAYLVQKLVRIGFGSNNIDHCTRLCHASSVAALMEGIGSAAVTAPFNAAMDADVIVVIGARPTENHPVAATFIKNACRRGATLIVIDPRTHGLSRHADFHLQFKPGTDVALLNAIMHVIVEEDLVNTGYVQRFTENFPELERRLKDFPPERMAKITGIDAETIRAVARIYARAARALIFWGMGIAQHVHGTDNARCLIALAMMTGQVGRPGTGLHPLRGQNNVQGASDVGLIPMVYPDYRPVESEDARKMFEDFWGAELDPKRGLTVVEIMNAILEGGIKGMYIMGENPAMSDPDTRHVREALAALGHLVVQEIFLTETAFHADVVLPASAFVEKTGTFTNTNREVQLAHQVFEPPGEARQDLWIIQEIARRLGLKWDYRHPRDVYAEMREVMPSIKGITWERLEREGWVTYPCDAEDEPGRTILFGDGFPTENGIGRFVPADLLPPDEIPDESFPIVLTTGRMLEHWHTGAISRRADILDRLEPEPVCCLHPKALDALGVEAGGRVRVASRRGEIEIRARADRDVPPGMVFIPFCFSEAAANVLTNPKLDPFGKIPEFKYCAVRVDKVEA
ncbi:MAG: formate dehydrogenase subunit alpha [Rhodospirillales bacterium]|nr:formate dehydrogenase subunit alpha [Rhodospirillales bacterium]